jgi:hypothetical protein
VSFTDKRTHWTQIPAVLSVWKATCERGLWVDTLSPFKLVPVYLWIRSEPIFFAVFPLISIVTFIRYLLQQDSCPKRLGKRAKWRENKLLADHDTNNTSRFWLCTNADKTIIRRNNIYMLCPVLEIEIGFWVASVEGPHFAHFWQSSFVLQRVQIRCIYYKKVNVVCG